MDREGEGTRATFDKVALEITIKIPPGLLAINEKFEVAPIKRRGRGTRYEIRLTSSARATMHEAIMLVRQAVVAHGWSALSRASAKIMTHWPGDEGQGDVDATVKAVLDALEGGGVVHDDAVIRPVWLDARYNAESPQIVVVVYRDASALIEAILEERSRM